MAALGGLTACPYQEGIVYGQEGDDGTLNRGANLTDGQIAGVLIAANDAFAEASQLAYTNVLSTRVYRMAAEEILDHSAADARQMTLFALFAFRPEDCQLSDQISERGRIVFGGAEGRTALDFERAYMQGMIELHVLMLDVVNTRLLPKVSNEFLRLELESYRGSLEEHLGDARDQLGELGLSAFDVEADVRLDFNPESLIDEE